MSRILVYVAAPLGAEELHEANTREAVFYAEKIMRDPRLVAYVPHTLGVKWHSLIPHEYEFWIQHCLDMVERADIVFRAPGHSPGADREVIHAQRYGIPVAHSVRSIDRLLKVLTSAPVV